MSLNKLYDVLIVGAGPVGLATGLALYQRGITNILIIDQTRSFRRVGQVVDMLPNGLKALKYIDEQAYQQVKQTGLEFIQIRNNNGEVKGEKTPQKRFWYQKNLQGKIIRSISLSFDDWFELYGEGRVSIPWYDLQTNLRKLLPSEIIKVNHRCVNIYEENITQEKGTILIDCISDEEIDNNPFAHWEMQPSNKFTYTDSEAQKVGEKQFKAKLVVAADGINSTIRKIIYTDSKLKQWAKPQYSGWAAINVMEIEGISDAIIEELEDNYFQNERLVTLKNDSLKSEDKNLQSPRLILIRTSKNAIGCLFHIPVSIDLLENKSPETIINLTADILTKAGFPPIFSQLIKLSNIDKLTIRPYYIRPLAKP